MAAPIQKVLVPVPFAGGIDTKTDPNQVIPGKLLALQNGILQKTGAVTRRWGYSALGTGVIGGTNIGSCAALKAFNDELILFDGHEAYSYIEAINSWAPRGTLVSVLQSNTSVIRNTNQQLSPDHARAGGVDVYAWEDSRGGVRYSLYDAASGAMLVGDQPLGMSAAFVRPRCLALGTSSTVAILVADASGGIYVALVNTSAPSFVPTVQQIVGTALAGNPYDAAADAFGNFVVAYYDASLGRGTVVQFGPNGVATSNFLLLNLSAATSAVFGVSVDARGAWWVAYTLSPSAGIALQEIDPSFLSGWTATVSSAIANNLVVSLGVAPNNVALGAGTGATVYIEARQATSGAGAQPYNRLIYQNTVTNFGATLAFPAGAVPVWARGVGLASKPFSYNGATYVNVAFQTNLQPTYFTLNASGHAVSKALAGLGGGTLENSDLMLPGCQQVSPGVFIYANLVKGQSNSEAGAVFALLGVNATTLNFSQSNNYLSASINGCLYTVGGIVQSYDGAAYHESGFHYYPDNVSAVASSTGGLLGTGTYNYCVTYEWEDNNGATLPSTPSVALAVTTTAATSSVTLTIPTLRLTSKTNVKIAIYRTAVNGTIFNRITSAAVPVYNVTTADTVTFVDTLSDASIASNGLMYTQPLVTGADQVLPNAAPPACSLVEVYANRLWISGVDDPYTLWYSQATVLGTPAQFSASLTFRVDPDGGPITAIKRMDNNFFIFKRNAIMFISGQGPTATGDQNDLAAPVVIPSGNVGCSNPNTIVLTPLGLLFQSANGIYLLDRSLNVTYKGAPVEGFNGLTLTSATLVPNQWVIFTSSSGTALVYDYFYDQWSTFTNHEAVDSDLYLGAGDLYVYANPNGQVFLQTPANYSDNGNPIHFSLTTAWLNPNVVQGFQRIYHAFLLGTYYGTHTLNVAAGFDFDQGFTAYAIIPSDTTLGLSGFGSASPFGEDVYFGGAAPGQAVYQYRLDILRKCQAVRFQISDTQSPPGDQGFSLSALTLLVGVRSSKGNTLPAGKQFGMN